MAKFQYFLIGTFNIINIQIIHHIVELQPNCFQNMNFVGEKPPKCHKIAIISIRDSFILRFTGCSFFHTVFNIFLRNFEDVL